MPVTSKMSSTSKKSDLTEDAEETPYAIKGVYRGHNLVAFIIGIPIPAVSIWLWTRLSTGSGCETFINLPLLIIGILVIVFSICGVALANENPFESFPCCSRETIMFLLLCSLLGYGIFVFSVTSAGGGRLVAGRAYQDYVLDDYSPWLQKRVNNTDHWDNHLKKCLLRKDVCHKFFHEYANDSSSLFFSRNLSSIESGCCKPPTECNFNYTSATQWAKPKEGNHSSTPDCNAWDDDPKVLCFNCQSCKAGFANDVKSRWIIVGVVIIVVICFVAFVCPCASCKGGFYTLVLGYCCVQHVMLSGFADMIGDMSEFNFDLSSNEGSRRSESAIKEPEP